ncbi:MAG: sigma-54 dependent transcriptional regulator [Duncaniella sp.]|uniref:sigma-54-dependent transcriptional regulator n=1 Tax=Duncaniella sp. TaxID=2518496 RepID=UPI0023C15A43|nr:sigma-54 dependent transcriptional regulator [Duncaniella sp.]MDE5988548.1 sigma-54 dependent transcriptional regulator [Duncaniella sp.]
MILIVDDDSAVRLSLKLLLSRNGFETVMASSPREAMEVVRAEAPQLIMLDMNFSRATTGEEGITLLRQIKIFRPETPVILMTAWGSIPLAVEGIHAGAFDFITKPWDNAALLKRINVALELNAPKTDEPQTDSGFDRSFIIGRSPALMNVLDTIERIAATDAPVLIMGENGTGKELIAEAIHRNSRRKGRNMVKVNLGGIASSLFESEMFGHRKGAFTGAVADREGRFAMADGGTIFLDEIGELDLNCQVKLLRVLQEHTYEMLGDSRQRQTDVRVVCATNANLPAMVAEKTFREDLFYRINLITVTLPPLRERREDIPLLVDHIVRQHCAQNERLLPEITSQAMEFLSSLPYPGNIRELKNFVERTLLVNSGDRLGEREFRGQYDGPLPQAENSRRSNLELREREAVEQAIAHSGGNLTRAAALLGITRQSLYRRMEKYGITQ